MSNNNLPIDLSKDIYSLYNVGGELTLFYQPVKALFFYPNRTIDLLASQQSGSGVTEFLSLMKAEGLEYEQGNPKVILTFYELGHFFENTKSVSDQTPLGVWLEYSASMVIEDRGEVTPLAVQVNPIDYSVYEKAFLKGREHLLRGDCYQYNLTFPQELVFDDIQLEEFVEKWFHKEQRSEYANLTSIGDKLYYSNSPECLFELDMVKDCVELHTRPIKGTVATEGRSADEAWEQLKASEKNQSELYMITDLLRNDLNRIENPCVEVVAAKERLDVPGLVHSYSHLKVQLSNEVNLLQLMQAVFPGGSITGAPKKRVMEIIADLEISNRGFYCGSSILKTDVSFRASINIRSGEMDKAMAQVLYWSGGGVTIKSDCREEYQEIVDKTLSFVRFLS